MSDSITSLGLSSGEAPQLPYLLAVHCGFCGLGDGEVARLFQGQDGFICDECVDVCLELLADYRELDSPPPEIKRPWYQRWFGEEKSLVCSFTPHDHESPQGERLFPGPGLQICEQCIRACAALKSGDYSETGL